MASICPLPTASRLSQTVKRSLIQARWTSQLPIRTITTISHTTNPSSIPEPLLNSSAHRDIPKRTSEFKTTPKPHLQSASPAPRRRPFFRKRGPPPPPIPASTEPRSAPQKPATSLIETAIDPSIKELLPLLRTQSPFYISVHIHEKPYLVTRGDSIRLPFLMHGVQPGDILRLNRATLLGSRDYTLKAGAPGEGQKHSYLDERLFTCRATVLGVESEPLRIKEKTKRRQRHTRRIKSKHRYTILRIGELEVSDVDALEGDGVAAQGDGLAV